MADKTSVCERAPSDSLVQEINWEDLLNTSRSYSYICNPSTGEIFIAEAGTVFHTGLEKAAGTWNTGFYAGGFRVDEGTIKPNAHMTVSLGSRGISDVNGSHLYEASSHNFRIFSVTAEATQFNAVES
jgi:hypothetical protein